MRYHLLVLQVESLEETALRLEKTELSLIRRSALKNKYRVRRCAKNRQESVKLYTLHVQLFHP